MRAVKNEGNGGKKRSAGDNLHHEIQNQRNQRGFQDRMPIQKGKEAAPLTRFPVAFLLFGLILVQGEHFLSLQ